MNALYACASHLLIDLPLFGGPAVMIIAAIALITRAERRRARLSSRATPAAARPAGDRHDPRLPASSGI